MKNYDTRFWVWGYTLDTIPGKIPYYPGNSKCSLETAADYMKAGSIILLNSAHDETKICDKTIEPVKDFPNIVMGLTHIEANGPGLGGWQLRYKESAELISKLSLKYPNITGAIIDDFITETSPSRYITVDYVKSVKEALTSANPNLKLYVVQYLDCGNIMENIKPFLPYIDCINIWCWRSTDYFWKSLYEDKIRQWRETIGDKPLIQGQFLHAYGDDDGPQPMDQVKLQCKYMRKELDRNNLQGWCLLQNGWFCDEDHKEALTYIKDYWDWFRGTRTIR